MTRRPSLLLLATLSAALLIACDPDEPTADAGVADAGSKKVDAGSELPSDAGTEAPDGSEPEQDAGTQQTDAGEMPDAGEVESDGGSVTPDGGSHEEADPLEYCGSGPTITPGRTFTVMLNGEAVDFSSGYSWGSFIPGDASFWAEATFTWASTSGEYYLTLSVMEGFSETCPTTISLPDDHVILNLFGESAETGESIDLFSSDEGASGSLKLDAYDLAGGACAVSIECDDCRLVWGSDDAVVDGRVVESCQ